MEIPTIILPDIVDIETVEIPLPTADVPYYEPMVVPPSDLRDQKDEPVKTVEETPEPPTLKIPFIKQPVPQPSAEVVVAACLLYTSPSPRDKRQSRMPSSA